MKRTTSSSNYSPRLVFGYKIKDISTVDLHKEADILTPYQKSFYDKAVMFWRIINNCEPLELYMDLLIQGSHIRRQARWKWVPNEKNIKDQNSGNYSSKVWWVNNPWFRHIYMIVVSTLNLIYFYKIMMIPYHSCISKI